MTDRMQKLQQMLAREPEDTFLLYALAMEYRKTGELPEALKHLEMVLKKDAGYCVAYHQMGLIHEQAGDLPAARDSYRNGMAAAAGKGDFHARDEMQAALSMIE
jgi:Tfp pilus assembly protein PilF